MNQHKALGIWILCFAACAEVYAETPAWKLSLDHANLLRKSGDAAKAEQVFQKAVAQARAVDDGGLALARVWHDLGLLYYDQSRLADAETLMRKALAIEESNPRALAENLAATLHNLAAICGMQGRSAEAVALHLKAIAKFEAMGSGSNGLARSLNAYARLYLELGKHVDAERLLRRALRSPPVRPAHGDTVIGELLLTLAEVQLHRGDVGNALVSARRALRIIENASSENASSENPNRENVDRSTFDLARALYVAGRCEFGARNFREAGDALRRSLRIYEGRNERASLEMTAVRLHLAELSFVEGRPAEAERTIRGAIDALEPRGETPELASTLRHLARMLDAQKRDVESEQTFRRSLAIGERVFGGSRPDMIAAIRGDYAALLARMRRFQDAADEGHRAIATMSEGHPALAQLLERHSRVLRKLKRSAEAHEVEQRANALRASTVPYSHSVVDVDELRKRR